MKASTAKYYSRGEMQISQEALADVGIELFVKRATDGMKEDTGRDVRLYFFTFMPWDYTRNLITLLSFSEVTTNKFTVTAPERELPEAIRVVKSMNSHLKFELEYKWGRLNDDFESGSMSAELKFDL